MEEWLSMGEGGDMRWLAGWLGTRTRRSVLRTRSAAAGSLAAQIGGMGEPPVRCLGGSLDAEVSTANVNLQLRLMAHDVKLNFVKDMCLRATLYG